MTPAQFLEVLASVSLQAAILVFITHWLCRVVETPRLQCRLWNSCHLLILLAMLSGLVLPHFRVPGPWQLLPSPVVRQVVILQAALGKMAIVIWIAGAFISLLLLIRGWARAFRFLKSCRVANKQEESLVVSAEWLPDSGGEARMSRPVQLLISNHLGSPFCCQWHQPQLVIPEFLLELPPEQIRLVARHELEHLGYGHPLQLFMERLVATAFWFHPAIWWASRQSALMREFACDDAAVRERREIVSYLKVLLAIAERGLSEEASGAVLFFGRGASVVARRGERLLSRAETTTWSCRLDRMGWLQAVLATLALGAGFVWVPVDALASSRTNWSPWPQWSANVLRTFDIPARDFEPYELRTRLHEISVDSQLNSLSWPNASGPNGNDRGHRLREQSSPGV